jgi:hypothetical protein
MKPQGAEEPRVLAPNNLTISPFLFSQTAWAGGNTGQELGFLFAVEKTRFRDTNGTYKTSRLSGQNQDGSQGCP